MEYPLIEEIIKDKPLENSDWHNAAVEYLELRSELQSLQTMTGFKAVLNARERLKYLRRLSQEFQFTDFGRLLVRSLWENDFKISN